MNLIGLKLLTVIGFCSPALQALDSEFNAAKDVRFWLLERGVDLENSDNFVLTRMEALMESSFDASKPTTFQVHGYREGLDVDHHEDTMK